MRRFEAREGDPILSADRERIIGYWDVSMALTMPAVEFPVMGGEGTRLALRLDYGTPAIRVWRLEYGEEADLALATRYFRVP